GMLAFLDVNDAGAAKLAAANSVAAANADTYAYAPGVTLTVSDPGKGVIANDINVYGVQALVLPTSGTLTLYPNGTFTYAPTGSGTDHFTYCANGTVTAGVCSSGLTTTVTLNLSATANAANRPQANNDSYPSKVASILRVAAPGVLGNDVDPNGFPMTAVFVTKAQAGLTVFLNADGSFTATKPAATGCPATGCTFTYQSPRELHAGHRDRLHRPAELRARPDRLRRQSEFSDLPTARPGRLRRVRHLHCRPNAAARVITERSESPHYGRERKPSLLLHF